MQVRLTASADGRVLATATIDFVDPLPEVEVEQVAPMRSFLKGTLRPG
jgi:hypothetical protein